MATRAYRFALPYRLSEMNVPKLGIPQIHIDGKRYKLKWGAESLIAIDGEEEIKIKNTHLSSMLAKKPLHEVLRREINKNK